jgi:hypothetical protein
MRILVSILLLIHGIITSAQTGTGFNLFVVKANPIWFSCWSVNLGQSWVFERLV